MSLRASLVLSRCDVPCFPHIHKTTSYNPRSFLSTSTTPGSLPLAHTLHPLHPLKNKPLRAIIMGCPGAGKGTQTKKLAARYGIQTLSSGDILRSNVLRGTPVGLRAKQIINAGALVDDNLVSDLMLAEMDSLPNSLCFVLDGFPRTVGQAKTLDDWLKHRGNPSCYVILQRIEDRWIHAPSGRTYNISYNPPVREGLDDITGEPLTKREDDNVQVFKSRLDTYREQTMPLMGYYNERGILCNFKGSTSDQIFPKIQDELHLFYSFSDADISLATSALPPVSTNFELPRTTPAT
ncbi:hypothetical protein BASA62_007811 [Batrachochytrium salamandrivorans]|nr:hypothetical protein BASA62_007811 [Batrachochytrium salamandrivorans]